MLSWENVLKFCGAGLLVATVSTPLLRRIALALNLVDNPAHRKIHKQPVPYLGGIAIFLGFVTVVGVAFWNLSAELLSSKAQTDKLTFIIASSLAAVLLGIVDDTLQIRARYKLTGQLCIVSVFVLLGYRFNVLSLPPVQGFALSHVGIVLTIGWMLGVINGMNLIDGIDGLAGTVGFGVFIAIAVAANFLGDTAVLWLALAGASGVLGFMYFNWKPARIYMGDAGSIGIGMLVATMLVSLGQKDAFGVENAARIDIPEPFLYHLPLATMIAIYPLLEVTLSVLRRVLAGKSISSADRGHIHHRLLQKGWKVSHVCLFAVGITAATSSIVIYTLIQYRGMAGVMMLASGIMLGMLLHICGYISSLTSVRESRPHFLIANYFVAMQKEKLELSQSLVEVITLINQTCVELGVHYYSIVLTGQQASSDGMKYEWNRPTEVNSNHLPQPHSTAVQRVGFSDQADLQDATATISWTFEPHDQEHDIDIEYRLLMSEFMRQSLSRSQALYEQADETEIREAQRCDPKIVSSNMLKRRASQKRGEALRQLGDGLA